MSRRSISSQVREKAAAWRSRQDAGLTEAQAAEFVAWLDADDRHAIAFTEIDATWRVLKQLQGECPAGEPNPDLLSPADVLEFPIVSGKTSRRSWRGAVAVFAMAAAVAIVLLIWRVPENPSAPAAAMPLVQQLDLPDGSIVQLNADSHVELGDFTSLQRQVRLTRGEAHFVVAPDPDRPFLVSIRNITVRAVGTAFNIRLARKQVEVLVTEGKIGVEDADTGGTLLPATKAGVAVDGPVDALLLAGERALILTDEAVPAPAQVEVVTAPEMAKAIAWRSRRLEFIDVTLADAVAAFNHHNRHQLRIADPQLAARRFGGTFLPNAHEAFVRLLESDFGVVAERHAGETVLRQAQ